MKNKLKQIEVEVTKELESLGLIGAHKKDLKKATQKAAKIIAKKIIKVKKQEDKNAKKALKATKKQEPKVWKKEEKKASK